MVKAAVAAAVLGLVTVALIVYSALNSYRELCQACVAFDGRTECREAWGRTRDDAIRTAVDNACGLLASGMTDSVRCTSTPPVSTTCHTPAP